MAQNTLKGKIYINAVLRLETGLHIGASSDFAPIGAVDSQFIRDPYTKQPIIPGSSLKGKLRTLLAKSLEKGPVIKGINEDDIKIKRLFGSANAGDLEKGIASRLQFFDIKMTADSIERMEKMNLDTYLGEIKFENTIGRLTAQANPRQIERVPAGAEFTFQLIYNIENPDEFDEDMNNIAFALKILQIDYLGGHGSRGYGRVSLHNFTTELIELGFEENNEIKEKLTAINEKFEKSNVLKRG